MNSVFISVIFIGGRRLKRTSANSHKGRLLAQNEQQIGKGRKKKKKKKKKRVLPTGFGECRSGYVLVFSTTKIYKKKNKIKNKIKKKWEKGKHSLRALAHQKKQTKKKKEQNKPKKKKKEKPPYSPEQKYFFLFFYFFSFI